MRYTTVSLISLRASGQPRPLITDAVDRLAQSMKEVGLIQPIIVRPAQIISGVAQDGYQIVAGHHRVAAARALGWEEISAIIIDSTEHLQAELVEIDENLMRAELTPAQRAAHIKRRKQIWEALHPAEKNQVEQIVPPEIGYGKPPQQEKGFAAETAAATGQSKQDINRHIARAAALGDDINEVVGTSLDKGVELDALAKKPEPERKELIERAKAGEKVSARSEPPKATNGEGDMLVSWLECTAKMVSKMGGMDAALEWAKTVHLTSNARLGLAFYVNLDAQAGEVAPPKARRSTAKPQAISMPPWLSADSWAMWDRFRKAKSARAWTHDAKLLSIRELSKLREAGHDPSAVIEQSIQRGWTGLFEVKQRIGATNARPSFAQQRAQAEIDDFVNGPGDDSVIEMEVRRVGD